MTYGTTIRDLCLRFNPHSLRIDEQRLVQFGVLKDIIRRIQKVIPIHPFVRLTLFNCWFLFQSILFTNRKDSSGALTTGSNTAGAKVHQQQPSKVRLYTVFVRALRLMMRSVAALDSLTVSLTRKSKLIPTFVFSGSDDSFPPFIYNKFFVEIDHWNILTILLLKIVIIIKNTFFL